MKTPLILLTFAFAVSAHAGERKVLVTDSLVDVNNQFGEGQHPLPRQRAPRIYRLRTTYQFAIGQEVSAEVEHVLEHDSCFRGGCSHVLEHQEGTLALTTLDQGRLTWELFDQRTGKSVGRHEEGMGYQPTLNRRDVPMSAQVDFAGDELMPVPARVFSDKPQLPGVDFALPDGRHLYFAWALDESLFSKGTLKIEALGGERYRLSDIDFPALRREYLSVGAFLSPSADSDQSVYLGGPGQKSPNMPSQLVWIGKTSK